MSLGTVESKERFRSFVKECRDPEWIIGRRKDALSFYEEAQAPPPPSRDRNFPALDPAVLPFEKLIGENLSISCENKKTIALSLAAALKSHEEIIRSRLGDIIPSKKDKWTALNSALWQDGGFVLVPRNVDAGNVIIRHELRESQPLLLPRNLIIAENGGGVIVIDHYSGSDSRESFAAPVVEIVAEENSEVVYVQIQELGEQTHHHSYVRINAGRDARITTISCVLGGKRSVNHIDVSLQGQGGHAELLGFVLGGGDQVFEHYTLQEHLAPQTESDLLIKVALKEKAYSHFDGLIWIEKGAKKTNAYQQNRNLLLSKEAKAESTPRLEILDNDVRCTHGATVGPVDEEQLFYLASRGIISREAEALIVEGFFRQVMDRIPVQSLQEKLWGEIARGLEEVS